MGTPVGSSRHPDVPSSPSPAGSVSVTDPTPQLAHAVAPAESLYVPAGQSWHCVVESAVYLPAAHAVQLEAPAEARVLVVDPTGHV